MEAVRSWSSVIGMAEETGATVDDLDAQLMLRFKDGDTDAFDRLFARHTRNIVNFSYRFVRNREMAEELAQEIFIKVYENAAGYRVQARFTSWLYRIATNVCLNEIRKPRFRAPHRSLDAPPRDGGGENEERTLEIGTAAGPDAILERKDLARIIKQALGQIPEKQRVAFILNKYQELSYSEVAAVLDCSEKAVKSLIHRAKEALAERLAPLTSELLPK
ncbi:MAG: RNA polymerase sigma factor [Acidobacteria bacterium]|nr:RNA polymerase sigma factor [Acidobacteriota bacterium]